MIQRILVKGRLYDGLKWFTVLVLPAFGTFYFSMAGVWGLPHADEVTKTVVALALFLGTIFGFSNLNYNHSDDRFDGTAYMDRLDPTNNPDIVLKDDGRSVPKQLVLKVQETQPPVVKPEPGDGVVKTE